VSYKISIIEKLVLKMTNIFKFLFNLLFDEKKVYTYLVASRCKKVGIRLVVNGECKGFNKNVTLGDFVNFNGCEILGTGEVIIGDYFHSGRFLNIITQNHRYENADSIPYDKVRIRKKTVIKNFVGLVKVLH
jgi:chloramphenicol O-acetyltransferase type B